MNFSLTTIFSTVRLETVTLTTPDKRQVFTQACTLYLPGNSSFQYSPLSVVVTFFPAHSDPSSVKNPTVAPGKGVPFRSTTWPRRPELVNSSKLSKLSLQTQSPDSVLIVCCAPVIVPLPGQEVVLDELAAGQLDDELQAVGPLVAEVLQCSILRIPGSTVGDRTKPGVLETG